MPNDRTGHVNSRNWSFDYAVSDSEGLALLNGSFNGRSVFGKFSMPVIRVKYEHDKVIPFVSPGGHQGSVIGGVIGGIVGGIIGGAPGAAAGYAIGSGAGHAVAEAGAGPFADQIGWHLGGDHGLQRIANRNNEYIGLTEYTDREGNWVEISIYARIGAYHLSQQWHLGESGVVKPRIFSKGLHINMDHTHHPYWRLDFDIDGPEHNRVCLHDNRGWWHYPKEANDVKVQVAIKSVFPMKVEVISHDRKWFVKNRGTHRGAWIRPDPENDGVPDGFSGIDMAVRRFHTSEESKPWQFGTNGLGFLNNEDVGDDDVVFWYVGHMHHEAAQGGDHWHHCGPRIELVNY